MQQVTVDNDFARFGAKSYAINKITSVEVRERRPHASGCGIALLILAGLFVLLAIGAIASEPGAGVMFLILAAAIAGGGYWQYKRSKIIEYQLFLITSAAETQAFVTRDVTEVADLRAQIEGAMARHSQGGGI